MNISTHQSKEPFIVAAIVGHYVTIQYKDGEEIERPISFGDVDEAFKLIEREGWIDASEMPLWARKTAK